MKKFSVKAFHNTNSSTGKNNDQSVKLISLTNTVKKNLDSIYEPIKP